MDAAAHLERSRAYAAPGWRALDQLGQPAPYAPSVDSPVVRTGQKPIFEAPLGRLGIPINLDLGLDGYLQREDALKIFELAFIAPGDVLELGTHKGLSTSIIARALEERGGGLLETVDIDADANAIAREAVAARPGGHRVIFTLRDAALRMDELIAEGRRFGYIFIDHWHGYEATFEAARRCADLLAPGGWVQFHDFLDPGNADPDHVYGVYQAVLDTICEDPRFALPALSGCTAVFRFHAGHTPVSREA